MDATIVRVKQLFLRFVKCFTKYFQNALPTNTIRCQRAKASRTYLGLSVWRLYNTRSQADCII